MAPSLKKLYIEASYDDDADAGYLACDAPPDRPTAGGFIVRTMHHEYLIDYDAHRSVVGIEFHSRSIFSELVDDSRVHREGAYQSAKVTALGSTRGTHQELQFRTPAGGDSSRVEFPEAEVEVWDSVAGLHRVAVNWK